MSGADPHAPSTFPTVGSLLDYIGRDRLRAEGFSSGRLTNWAHRDGKIPPRHIPFFAVLCAERGVDLPIHLFNVQEPAEQPAPGEAPKAEESATT